jgi:hypothetical protein
MLEDLRQFSFPPPFRIEPASVPEQMQGALERLAEGKGLGAAPDESTKLLVALATEVFRLRQKMLKPGSPEPQEEMRRAWRHVEAVWDLFHQAEYEIQDLTGKRFEIGLELTVVAYQPTPGIDRETIIETLRPSIYHRGIQIQRGEVVVGKPETAGPAKEGGEAAGPGHPAANA